MKAKQHDFLTPGEKPTGYLRETQNFLDLLLYIRNRDKAVPEVWYTWAGLSLLAACVADRCWISPEPNNPIYPNLYVILMGESGSGKGQAISHATRLLPTGAEDIRDFLGYFPGGTSDKALKDFLIDHPSPDGHSSHAWVIASELADSVGGPEEARRLIVTLTALYTGEIDTIKDHTRKWGLKSVPRGCVNFLAGSTKAWFQESIGVTTAEGGFLARCFVIPGQAAIRRTAKNTVPADFWEVFNHLRRRLYKYAELSGEFTFSSEAFDLLDFWLRTRPVPTNRDLLPSFQRSEVQVYKLAMLLSIADRLDLLITADHLREAISLYDSIKKMEVDVLNYLAAEPDSRRLERMRDLLKEAGSQGMSTTEWNLAMAKFGMRTGRITELRKTLESSGEVVSVEFPRAGATRGKPRVQWYWWEYQLPGAVNLHVDPVTSAAHPEAAASTPLADAPTATPEGYTNGYANGNGNGALLSFLTEPPQLPPAALAKKLFGGPRSED